MRRYRNYFKITKQISSSLNGRKQTVSSMIRVMAVVPSYLAVPAKSSFRLDLSKIDFTELDLCSIQNDEDGR